MKTAREALTYKTIIHNKFKTAQNTHVKTTRTEQIQNSAQYTNLITNLTEQIQKSV